MPVWLVTGLDSGSGVRCADAVFTRIVLVSNITYFVKSFQTMIDLHAPHRKSSYFHSTARMIYV